MKTSNNLVSVILPTYNGATRGNGEYLRQALESVLNQSHENFELIIINDGSTDNTENLIKSYRDKRIIYLKNESNKGLGATRNRGLRIVKGDYICFLDDDDLYYENRINTQLNKMLEDNSDVSICGVDIIDEKGKIIRSSIKKNFIVPILDICLINIHIYPSSLMISRNLFNRIGYFKEYICGVEDYDYIIRIALNYNIYYQGNALFAYRLHSQNMTKNLEQMFFNKLFNAYEVKKDIIKYFVKPEHYYFYVLKTVYNVNNLREFRKYYKIVSPLGKAPFEWRMKYILSYFPFITKFIVKHKLKDKFYRVIQKLHIL